MAPIRCICVGNAYRHDDGVGLEVARLLAVLVPPAMNVDLIQGSGEPAAILDALQGAERAIVVDAAAAVGAPAAGTIRRVVVEESPQGAGEGLPGLIGLRDCSTHSFGVAEAIALARALRQLPLQLVVYAIEGADFTPGEGLSPAVALAAQRAAALVLAELGEGGR